MSEALTTQLTAAMVATLTNTTAFGTASFPLSLPSLVAATLSSGTGADKADQLYAQQFTLGAGGIMDLNLSTMAVNGLAAPLDYLGASLGVATIKMLALQARGNLGCSYVATAAVNTAGSGYVTNDVVTLLGGNYLGSVVIHSSGGGSSYAVGDVLTIAGGTGTAATVQVLTVSSGAIVTLAVKTIGAYSVNPTTSGNSATGGSGSGASLDLTMLTGTPAQIKVTTGGGGAVTLVQSITVVGSYIALPPVSACTCTGGTGTGAKFDLTLTTVVTPVFVEGDYLTVGNRATAAGWTSFLGANTHTMLLKSGTTNCPGTIILCEGGATGWVVGTSTTNNILRLTNSGSNPVTFQIVVVGATA